MNDITNSNQNAGGDDGDNWTVDEGAARVADALGDFLDDDSDESNDAEDADDADEADDSEGEADDNSEADDPDDEDDESEDPDEDEDDETSEGSDRVRDSKGRFVSDDYRVTLADGTTTTIGELKASGLRMGDYTRKTQEVAETRRVVAEAEKRVSQQAQQLDEQLAQVSWVLEQFKPKVPPAGSDPDALDAYHQQNAQWDQLTSGWTQELEKRKKVVEEQQAQRVQQHLQAEQAKLVSAIPQLNDPAKRQAFYAEAVKLADEYGIAESELQTVLDHRFYVMMRDLMRARRAQSKVPAAKDAIQKSRKMNRGSKRGKPQAAKQRAARDRTERLRREGTVEAGVAALINMDL